MKIINFFTYIVAISVLSALSFPSAAQGVRPDSLRDTLSDSRKGTLSNHTVVLDLSSSTQFVSGETVILTFPSGFNLSSITVGDVDFINGTTDETLQTSACGATDTIRWELSGQVMTFTACNSYTPESAGTAITIRIGTNASGGVNRITNHATAGSYTLTVSGTYGDDSQDTILVITEPITFSATVDEVLTLTVAGVTTANCPNPGNSGSETEIDTSGSATTVPFGTINTEAFYGACQQLTITTNASGGYNGTVQTATALVSGSNTFPKGTCDGSCTDTSEAGWATNTNNGYGYCMSNETGDPATEADSGWGTNGCSNTTTYWKTIANAGASQTAQAIVASSTSVSGDSAYIKYRISADATQAAGAYSTTIVYIITGTF